MAMDIQKSVDEIREYKRMIEDLEKEVATIQEQLKSYMQNAGVSELSGFNFKITWKPVVTSRFDSKAFQKANPEMYQQFVKQSETKRFLIA